MRYLLGKIAQPGRLLWTVMISLRRGLVRSRTIFGTFGYFFPVLFQRAPKLGSFSSLQLSSAQYHQIQTAQIVMMHAKNFPDDAFGAVAIDCAPEVFFRNRQSQARLR